MWMDTDLNLNTNSVQQVERLFQKLRQLIEKHYDCEMLYFPLHRLRLISAPQQSRARLLLHLAHSKQPIVLDQRLYIPLWQNGSVTGVVEIRRKKSESSGQALTSGPDLTPLEIKRLHDFVSLTLEAALPLEEKSSQVPTRGPYLIKYKTKAQLLKAALELHEAHRGLALVEYHQLDLALSSQVDELMELNSITLLIADLNRLSTQQAEALSELLNRQSKSISPSQLGPLIIAGSCDTQLTRLSQQSAHLQLTQSLNRGSYINLTGLQTLERRFSKDHQRLFDA